MSGAQMVAVLRAAGEPTRLRVLLLLAQEELAVMELGQILEQSQPRVSRHLKLLADAGLVERFPDGAWVFYRLIADGFARQFLSDVVAMTDLASPDLASDLERLKDVRRNREQAAAGYFARNAARWDEIRSLYVDESEVEAAILRAAGARRYERLIDLGTGAGRMLTLLGPKAAAAVGLDLSQHMLNIARATVASAGLEACELRHGDIFRTGLASGSGDLIVIHRVLHFLNDPGAALLEASRLLAADGLLLIVDFAPHDLEHLRQAHQHRRLGFSDDEISRWLEAAGLTPLETIGLPPSNSEGLTVKIWSATRPSTGARANQRSAA